MQDIALPKKIDFSKGDKPNQSLIIVEPLFPGYGMTLGNSLRRVLLSSLPGAAVIGVKIEGAEHEFMPLPHVQEDVLEIVLNLKKLRLEVFNDEEIKLDLSVHGKKEVLASDITKNSNVEIKNPELVLAHITDMAGSLKMEIFVSKGRGFQPIEAAEKENKEIGYIQMDANFSPVVASSVKVENTRVGKMTNWDKLILDVTTDGTISPKEAFEKSVKILVDQFNSFLSISTEEKKEEIKEEIKEEKIEESAEEESTPETEDAEGDDKKKRGRPKKS